jgi:hypothetical protein
MVTRCFVDMRERSVCVALMRYRVRPCAGWDWGGWRGQTGGIALAAGDPLSRFGIETETANSASFGEQPSPRTICFEDITNASPGDQARQ